MVVKLRSISAIYQTGLAPGHLDNLSGSSGKLLYFRAVPSWRSPDATARLRALTEAERTAVEKLAHSRTAPARQVERARIVWQASQGQRRRRSRRRCI